MDHKVSKDMISSGMIPSGEKTQADLGRIQYGSAPSPSSLMDAYRSIYEHHQKDKDGNTIPHQEDLNEGKMSEAVAAIPMVAGGISKAIPAIAAGIGAAGMMMKSKKNPIDPKAIKDFIKKRRATKPKYTTTPKLMPNRGKPGKGGDEGSGIYDASGIGRRTYSGHGDSSIKVSGPGQGKPKVGKVKTYKVDPKTLKDEYDDYDLVDENTLLKGIQTVERGRESLAKNIGNVASTVGSDIKSAASTVYKDVKNAIKNRYQKFKDHQKARGMGLDLKGGKISSSGVYSKTSPGGGFNRYDLRFDTDLFDLVKGDLISEGLTDGEASRMMLEMHEEITFLYNLSESDKEELNELLGGKPGDGYFGHPNLNIKNPLAKKQTKEPVMPNAKGGGLLNKTAGQLGDRKMKYQELMKGM